MSKILHEKDAPDRQPGESNRKSDRPAILAADAAKKSLLREESAIQAFDEEGAGIAAKE